MESPTSDTNESGKPIVRTGAETQKIKPEPNVHHAGPPKGGNTVATPYRPVTSKVVVAANSGDSFALDGHKNAVIIGEDFGEKQYKKDQEMSPRVILAGPEVSGETSVITSVGAAHESANIVYCNLNDLDLAGESTTAGETYSFASLHSLADASTSAAALAHHQDQNRPKIVRIKEKAIPLETKTSTYAALPTIVVPGGVLQLKPESSISGVIAHPESSHEPVIMTVDSKLGSEILHTSSANHEQVVHSQIVTVSGSSRSQDAIASILASMNQTEENTVTVSAPLDYSNHVMHDVNSNTRYISTVNNQEVLPLNLATTSTTAQSSIIRATPQTIPVQGVKRVAAHQGGANSAGGLVTKKVIIATINGTQRILTPVSGPQLVALKGSPRIFADGTLLTANGAEPLTFVQKPVIQPVKTKVVNSSSPSLSTKSSDNKTCRWKFENGQICGKMFTKTYNLTVHMRMHQDIRPFPCAFCEQTFRQKAHLQRHEATHGIDSTSNRKRRKRPHEESQILEGKDDLGAEEEIYSSPVKKDKESLVKVEESSDLDPMIEPLDEKPRVVEKKVCPVTVGTNTEAITHSVDDIEENNLEPVSYKTKGQVEQGVQYNEADLLQGEEIIIPGRAKTLGTTVQEKSHVNTVARETQCVVVTKRELLKTEQSGSRGEEGTILINHDGVATLGHPQGHFITAIQEEPELTTTHFISQNAEGAGYVDTSGNHIVMSQEGELVGFVPVENSVPSPQVVNISTATNELGQQVVIIENLHHHSPELQREIMNALISESNLVPISHTT